jgi:CRP-like cAMP-binding protein
MELVPYLQQHWQLSSEIAEKLASLFKEQRFAKGQTVRESGTNSKNLYFIQKGLCRTYYWKEDKNITHYFFQENSFSMPIESIYYNQPSLYCFEALEDSIILSAYNPTIEAYSEKVPELGKVAQMLLIEIIKGFSDRLYAIQFQSASERYNSMIATYPNILLRAPLGNIASYLGITQQTLSLIRSQK